MRLRIGGKFPVPYVAPAADPAAPFSFSGTEFYLSPAHLGHQYQEVDPHGGFTSVLVATDPIGQVSTPVNGHRLSNANNANRPLLDADATRLASFAFGAAGAATTLLTVYNSKKSFGFTNTNSGIAFTIFLWAKAGSGQDSNAMTLFDSGPGTTTSTPGICLLRTTTGTLTFRITDGAGTAIAAKNTSTAQKLLVADGWQPVVIKVDSAAGTNGSSITIGSTVNTFTCQNTASATLADMGFDLTFGYRVSNSDQKFVGNLDQIGFWSRVLTDDEIATWKAYNPPPTTSTLAGATGTGATLTANQLNFLEHDFDTTDPTLLFQHADGTVAVSANNDPVKYIVNKVGARFKRDAVWDATSTAAAQFLTALFNTGTIPSVHWPGTASAYVNFTLPPSTNCDFSAVIAAQNLWVGDNSGLGAQGSTIFANQADTNTYFIVAGSGNTTPSANRTVWHVDDQVPSSVVVAQQLITQQLNVYELYKDNGNFTIYCNGVQGTSITLAAAAAMGWNYWGKPGDSQPQDPASGITVNLKGRVPYAKFYNARHTHGNLSKVAKGLCAILGITYP